MMWCRLVVLLCVGVVAAGDADEAETPSAGGKYESTQKLKWVDDDGLEVKIVRPIADDKCTIRSAVGDTVDQYYKLFDGEGNVIGSNFGKEPYTFTLGQNFVVPGMERAMLNMCIGEKRRVVIPGKLGFGAKGRDRDNIASNQTLHYLVQLVDLFRPVPGAEWKEDGISIKVTHKIEEAKCKRSVAGDTIHQQYKLHLADGTFVDSSYSRNAPFIFKLNNREVISGMDIAMTNMCEGEKRHVIIPPEHGYGTEGRPPQIPGNSELHFDIYLEKLIKKDEL